MPSFDDFVSQVARSKRLCFTSRRLISVSSGFFPRGFFLGVVCGEWSAVSVLGRVGVVGAVAGAVLLAGAGSGGAAVTALDPQAASVVTDDGWSVSVVASELRVDAVAPLSGSWLSREAFVSAK